MGPDHQYHEYLGVNWVPDGGCVELGEVVVRLRPGDVSDVDAMAAIELVSQPDPWNDEMFARELGLSWSRIWVVEEEGTGAVLGFLVFWIVEDEASVLSVAVAPGARRKGVAQHLMRELGRACVAGGLERVVLEVRVGNVGARGLYRGLGFKRIGRRKGYYEDGEDALVMGWELG